MKKFLVILAVLLLPLSAMAMTAVSDNEMANVTGQSGVTIDIAAMRIIFAMDTITWGDDDGLTTQYENINPLIHTTYTGLDSQIDPAVRSGYINMAVFGLPMNVMLGGIELTNLGRTGTSWVGTSAMSITFDVGTYTSALFGSKTAIKIGMYNIAFQLDAFGFSGIFLDNKPGALG